MPTTLTEKAPTSAGSKDGDLPSRCEGAPADLDLVRRARDRVLGASEELLDRLRCLARFLSVLNVMRGKPFDPHELADLSQDTVLVIWRKLDDFKGPAGLERWALQIARFEFHNAARRKARRTEGVVPLEGDERLTPVEDPADGMLRRIQLQQAMDELDPTVAETVRLKHYGGLTFEEIGRRMGCSTNTAKTRYYRSLIHLAKALGIEAQ
jgi:RNA polymerase sigma-70 factor (ECF subfamily)